MDISVTGITLLLICVLGVAGSASAQQTSAAPTSNSTTANAETASSTTAAGTNAQSEKADDARPSADQIKDARQFGYKLKLSTKTGTYVFCKTDTQTGTHLETTKCLPPDMLAQILDQQKRDQNYQRTQIEQMGCKLSKIAGGC